ncbi:hypothetical protein PV05_11570 [Exophiala xenobiotica]|uniref:Uncharacterized protein n=1 Tax=Exophiala xenobiotica TaxID=348802 RepID=A0A0D2EQA7_9EURO|nr:uncharacterized protein PV05_11570 [Exophiala xenobiotica]KIW49939.1 hypothetical protein PV05_11570 [Exophiala xenobiotica]
MMHWRTITNIIIFFLVLLWVWANDDPIVELLEMGMPVEARVSDFLWEWVDFHPEDFAAMMRYTHFAASVLFLWFSLSTFAKAYANSDRMQARVVDTCASCYQALVITMPHVTRNAFREGSRLLSDWLSSTLRNLMPTSLLMPENGFVPGAFPTSIHELWLSGDEDIAVDGMGETEDVVVEVLTVDIGVQTEDVIEEPAIDNRQALADENASLQNQNADLEASLDDLRAALATERLSRTEARVSTYRRRALEAERDSLRCELQALKGAKGTIETNSAGLRDECDALRGQNEDLKAELEDLKAAAARDSAERQLAIDTQQELEATRQQLRQEQQDRQAEKDAFDATKVTLQQCDARRQWLEGAMSRAGFRSPAPQWRERAAQSCKHRHQPHSMQPSSTRSIGKMRGARCRA